jgi:hypothetical protein
MLPYPEDCLTQFPIRSARRFDRFTLAKLPELPEKGKERRFLPEHLPRLALGFREVSQR